jgi:hypothetical protein
MRYLQSLLADDFPPSRGELRKQLRSRFAYSRKNCGGQNREKLEWALPPTYSGLAGEVGIWESGSCRQPNRGLAERRQKNPCRLPIRGWWGGGHLRKWALPPAYLGIASDSMDSIALDG